MIDDNSEMSVFWAQIRAARLGLAKKSSSKRAIRPVQALSHVLNKWQLAPICRQALGVKG